MTEREYTIATDLRALDCAIKALQTITPSNSPIIKPADFARIFTALDDWRSRSYAMLKVR